MSSLKIEQDPHFEWILDRIVKDGLGALVISKEYKKQFGRKITVGLRSINRYIELCKKEINTEARKRNRLEGQAAEKALKSGIVKKPAANNKKAELCQENGTSGTTGGITTGDSAGQPEGEKGDGKVRLGGLFDGVNIPASAVSMFQEAAQREQAHLLRGLTKVANVGEFMIEYGLTTVKPEVFVRAVEALFKMTGGQILEIEELSLYKQALEMTIRLLIKAMDYLPVDVRGEIHEEYLKVLALWDEEPEDET
jgi:hypothetical protein